jgi:membrane dipeptidase
MSEQSPKVFDGHNDLLSQLYRGSATLQQVREGRAGGHIDWPRARAGGFGGGLFALFVPSPNKAEGGATRTAGGSYDKPLPKALERHPALDTVLAEAAIFNRLATEGVITPCTTVAEIRIALETDRLAAVLHMEGAEAIDPDFHALEVLYAAGLRSLGPVWSRPTRYGHGVPFRYPSTGDTGPGLTDDGKRLVRECNRLRIMLDLSHLNEAGFDDIAALSEAPLVASHSNAHAICPHARNLTDRQLDVIAERDGLVGLNFASQFLRPDGRTDADFGFDIMLRHLDHLLARLGEDHVGLGSDFDGALPSNRLGDCAGLPALRQAMRQQGFDDTLMAKLCRENWLAVLAKTWGH